MSPSALPVVASHDQIHFPVRLADIDGMRRLMQLREIAFDFAAGGALFRARGRTQDARLELAITAELGCIPFSVQSREARREAIALLSAPPPCASTRIVQNSTVTLDGQVTLQEQLTPVTLVAALTEWVINVQPWISAIAGPLAASRLPAAR